MPDNIERNIQDTIFDRFKYKVNNHQYPEDLGESSKNNIYGNHKVVFFINVQGGGRIVKENQLATIDLPPSRYKTHSGDKLKDLFSSSKKSTSVSNQEIQITDAMGNVTGHTSTLTEEQKKIDEDSKNAEGLVQKALSLTKPKRRLETAISLYIPETLTKGYSVNWGEVSSEEMMGSEAMVQTVLGVSEAKGIGATLKAAISPTISKLAAQKINGMKYTQKAAGISPGNSKAEQLFQSVDFNSFSFDYRFAPKSEKEAANVLNIIRTFRHHMLPEYFDELNFLYIYPSEFDIRYYYKDKENDYLERHMTAVLKNMTINYNPNGQFTTFANGMPTHINMNLTFQELAVPTKETSPYDRPGA